MKIHFYTKGDEKIGDSRQRAMRIADELRERSIDTVVHWPPVVLISTTRWPKKFFLIVTTILSLFSIKKRDIVFLQRTIGNKYFFAIIVAYLTLFRRKMIFDFDDAIYMHDFYKTKKLVQMADVVFVCSRALQTWVRQYNKNVHIFHTTVKLADYAKYTKDYSVPQSPLIIGWVGTARDHYKNLSLLAEVFKKLPARTAVPFKFLLIGVWGFPKIKELFEPTAGLNVEFVEYLPPGKMAPTIQSFDIGVNPLVEKGEWNMSRSSYKPYEYMACGLAQITSAVGEITHVVHDGVNGYLADSVDEWVEKLAKLLKSRELRAQLGAAGQKTIREEESYEVAVPRMQKIIEQL